MGLSGLLRYGVLRSRARRSAVDHPPGTGKAPGSNPGESTHFLPLAALAPVVRGLADLRERRRRSLSPGESTGFSRRNTASASPGASTPGAFRSTSSSRPTPGCRSAASKSRATAGNCLGRASGSWSTGKLSGSSSARTTPRCRACRHPVPNSGRPSSNPSGSASMPPGRSSRRRRRLARYHPRTFHQHWRNAVARILGALAGD